MKLSQFKFKLPEEKIALHPTQKDGRNRSPYVQGYFGIFR